MVIVDGLLSNVLVAIQQLESFDFTLFIHIGWIPSRTPYPALSRQGYTLCTNRISFSKSSLLSGCCKPAQIDPFKFLPNPGTNCERGVSMCQWLHSMIPPTLAPRVSQSCLAWGPLLHGNDGPFFLSEI